MNRHPDPVEKPSLESPSASNPVPDRIRTELAPRFDNAWNSGLSESGFAEAANLLLEDATTARATDLHLDPHRDAVRVRFRIDACLYDAAELSPIEGLQLIRHLQVRAGIDAATKPDVHDGHIRLEFGENEINLRIASIPTLFGDKLSIRILDPSRTRLEISSIGFNPREEERLRTWMDNASGMFLATGPTGAGKTTTLYAVLNELSKINRNIISLEDPVELSLDAVTQVPVTGTTHMSFAEGLTRVLRHDPDILAVGEIRDASTARIAIAAALSGHPLLSSLSARDVAGAVSLLRNLGMENYQICAAIHVIVSQRTLRLLCPECKRPRRPSRHELAWLAIHELEAPDRAFESPGCRKCLGTGHYGIAGVFELWTPDETGYDLILGNADEKQIRNHLRKSGIPSLQERALELAFGAQVALRHVMWPDDPEQAPSQS